MRKIHGNSKEAVAEETEAGEDHRVPDRTCSGSLATPVKP